MIRGDSDAVVHALCEACNLAGEDIILAHGSDELKKWYKHHQRQDERRREQEAAASEKQKLRKQALKKLTAEERRALGIRG